MSIKKLTIFSVIFFNLIIPVACKVTWVPDYSAELEQQIAAGAKMNDKLYLEIMELTMENRKYAYFSEKYLNIESEINSIQFKNEARQKNAGFLTILKNLKDHFIEAKEYHKSKDGLSNGEIQAYRQEMKAFWSPLYFAERGINQNNNAN